MPDPLRIGRRLIGEGQRTFVIAEIGINHNGSEDLALRLIEDAKAAGADAVKFQKRDLKSLYTSDVLEQVIQHERHFQYMIPILRRVELDEEAYSRLAERCRELEIELLCTAFDPPSVDFVAQLGVQAFKVSSADLTNWPLLARMSAHGKPLLLSTGMSLMPEIEGTVNFLKSKRAEFAILHCVSLYPALYREVNLKVMDELQKFGVTVGYSGHDRGIEVSLAAVARGARIVEKHFTHDRTAWGPDHKVSLEKDEFARLVHGIRVVEECLGTGVKRMTQGEQLNRELFAKSLVAAADIKIGEVITQDKITVMGPGKGLSPHLADQLIGRTAHRDMMAGELFVEDDLREPEAPMARPVSSKKWGLIVRVTDVDKFVEYKPDLFEFHMTDRDLEIEPPPGRFPQNLVVHAPEYDGDVILDLASKDMATRQCSISVAQRVINMARKMGPSFNHGSKPKVILHPGGMSLNGYPGANGMSGRFIDSLRRLDTTGVEVLLENLPPFPWYFGGQWTGYLFLNPEEIAAFCAETKFNICLDTSHAQLYCKHVGKDIVSFVRAVRPYIRHLHVADAHGVHGEGVQIGEGEIPFEAVFGELKDYDEGFVPEIWRGHQWKGKRALEALSRLSRFL
ncbi:MAG: N-acetylneuraminate synthase family protein [Nitrospirae bacterium]|nr:N-acetylneuraminate synthase family protein [Nitrospirota bacterium]